MKRWRYLGRCSMDTPAVCETGWYPDNAELRWTGPHSFVVINPSEHPASGFRETGYSDVHGDVTLQRKD